MMIHNSSKNSLEKLERNHQVTLHVRDFVNHLKKKLKIFFKPDASPIEFIDIVGVDFSIKIPCGLYNNTRSKIVPSNKKSSQTTSNGIKPSNESLK